MDVIKKVGEYIKLPSVGQFISSVGWSEGNGFTVASAKVTSICENTKGVTIRAPKRFYPIRADEYDFAPNEEYPLALADYYFGDIPLTVDDVLRQNKSAYSL